MPASPGAPTLLLVPTAGELSLLLGAGGPSPLPVGLALTQRCGFGPIAAAARAAALIGALGPRRVLLCGIAGSYDGSRLPLGEARAFSRVAVEGIGAGEGSGLLSPAELGFAQWDDLSDSLGLEGAVGEALLVTACAASGGEDQADPRALRHPGALAEDMEAYGVALACHLADLPLAVVRGASNVVGDRRRSSWRVEEAMASAREAARELLETRDWSRGAAGEVGSR